MCELKKKNFMDRVEGDEKDGNVEETLWLKIVRICRWSS